MVSCVVKHCQSRSDVHCKSSNITFHRIPKDEILEARWIKCLKRAQICVSKSSRVCSKHFKPEHFYTATNGFQKLYKTAVPMLDLIHPAIRDNEKKTNDVSKPSEKPHSSSDDDQEIEQMEDVVEPKEQPHSSTDDDDQEVTQNLNGAEPTVKTEVEVFTHTTRSNIKNPNLSLDDSSTDDEEKPKTPLEKKLKRQMTTLELLCQKRNVKNKGLMERNRRLEKQVKILEQKLTDAYASMKKQNN